MIFLLVLTHWIYEVKWFVKNDEAIQDSMKSTYASLARSYHISPPFSS